MNVLIIGAGIGGLTAALCCVNRGFSVTVLEKAKALSDVGAGIQLPPNAMKVFQSLDLDTALRERAVTPEQIEARMGRSGRTVFNIPLADHAKRIWGAPYLHLHRADYIRVLAKALEARAPGSICLGQAVTGYEQTDGAVHARLADGSKLSADVLIGADGIHSAVQRQMLGPQSPRFTGNVAWRATVPMDRLGGLAPARTACVWMGEGRHAVTYQLRSGELANFVGVVERDDWRDEGWTIRGSKADLKADFGGWHPVIANLIEQVDEAQLYRWALFDREPLSQWTDGRTALLGDAAHPMLPFLAQGAAMAVEDGWGLAGALGTTSTVSEDLQTYAARRQVRTARAQRQSRANMKTFHKTGRAAQLAAYGPMWLAGKLAPAIVHQRMNWLYGHDVTSL